MRRFRLLAMSNIAVAAVAAIGWTMFLFSQNGSTDNSAVASTLSSQQPEFAPSPFDTCVRPQELDASEREATSNTSNISMPVLRTSNVETRMHCVPHDGSKVAKIYGLGHRMIVTSAVDDWLKVKSLSDGQEGWVRHTDLGRLAAPSTPPATPPTTNAPVREATLQAEIIQPRVRERTASDDNCRWQEISRGHWSCR